MLFINLSTCILLDFFFFLRGGNSLRKNKQISSEETQNAKIHKNFTFQINNVIKEIYFRNMNETH